MLHLDMASMWKISVQASNRTSTFQSVTCHFTNLLQQAVEAHRIARRRGSHIFLDNGLTDGGEVASLTRRSPLTPTKIPGTSFF
jgi:hypothetical protein